MQRTVRLSLAIGTAIATTGLVAIAGTTASTTAARPASGQAVASDLCLVVDPVYVGTRQVFGGGTYCVPVPDPQSPQPM